MRNVEVFKAAALCGVWGDLLIENSWSRQLVTLCRHAALKSTLVNFMGPLLHSLALLLGSTCS